MICWFEHFLLGFKNTLSEKKMHVTTWSVSVIESRAYQRVVWVKWREISMMLDKIKHANLCPYLITMSKVYMLWNGPGWGASALLRDCFYKLIVTLLHCMEQTLLELWPVTMKWTMGNECLSVCKRYSNILTEEGTPMEKLFQYACKFEL